MLINKKAVEIFRNRELDDFRWMKKLTERELRSALRDLAPGIQFKTKPWVHQLVCVHIALCYSRFMFLLDMGGGKTKIIADTVTQLLKEGKIKHALIFVPRAINFDSWDEDLALHSNLTCTKINVENTEQKWEMLANPTSDVSIISYSGMHLAVTKKEKSSKKKYNLIRDDKKIKHLKKTYQMICLDESHLLGKHDTLWFSLLKPIAHSVPYCYGMTGTAFGKKVDTLWPPFNLVDRGETFGETLGPFRSAFFEAKTNPRGHIEYTYSRAKDRELNRTLQHRSIRYDEKEMYDLPARVYEHRKVNMADEQKEHYLNALDGLINADGKLEKMHAQWLRMRQIVSGYLAWNDDNGSHCIEFEENPKLDDLEALIESLGEKKLIVCYDYTRTGQIITQRLSKLGIGHEWYYGGTKDKSGARRRFMDDPKCQVFVMNSVAGGTGNDGLQKVASHMYWFETCTPPELRMQTIKRLSRPGQKNRTFIIDAVMRGSCDIGILEDLKNGIDTHSRVVNKQPTNLIELFTK
jgi:hypothetical protein